MMLLSLPAIKTEFDFYYKFEQWSNMLTKAVRLSPPPPEPQPALAEVHEAQSQPQAPISTSDTPKES